ncbi:hypothetical protein, partial [Pseudomonas sp. SIMBA_067]|uniref:hypothetical protein n=1 Tax=Pseudomonas sp. SIMBA_067 TaxID=3085807 RepID=UPI00397B0E72
DKFDEGEVKYRLKEAGVLDKLHGELGSDKITDFILSFFDSVNGDVPQELSILGSDYIIGMPLHHNKREILFHKFILIR